MELTQEEYDELKNDLKTVKFQLQAINDNLEGSLTSKNFTSFRNTYVINAQDSLDASYPMYIHFNIIPEMVKIVSINVSFWFLNFRAYSTAAASGGAVSSESGGGETPTSSSGGGETPTSSSVSTPSGGGSTSGAAGTPSGGGNTSGAGGATTPTSSAGGAQTSSSTSGYGIVRVLSLTAHDSGYLVKTYENTNSCLYSHTHTIVNHTHTVTIGNHYHSTPNHTHPNHTHSTPAHTHPAHTHTVTTSNHTHTVTVAAHTHTGGAHTHGITYGIFEDSTSPTVQFYVSRDNGLTYSLPTGSYTEDHENIDITSMIDTAGSKMLKFESDARTRLSVQVTIKLDILA